MEQTYTWKIMPQPGTSFPDKTSEAEEKKAVITSANLIILSTGPCQNFGTLFQPPIFGSLSARQDLNVSYLSWFSRWGPGSPRTTGHCSGATNTGSVDGAVDAPADCCDRCCWSLLLLLPAASLGCGFPFSSLLSSLTSSALSPPLTSGLCYHTTSHNSNK